jgi:hypothetical protein
MKQEGLPSAFFNRWRLSSSIDPCYHKTRIAPRPGHIDDFRERGSGVADTTKIEDKTERKKLKRAARKKAAPKAKRTTPRGSNKKKVKKLARGQSKR